MRIGQAITVFFKVLFDREFAAELQQLTTGTPAVTEQPSKPAPPTPKSPPKPARSDAITLLAALQREARFVDMIMEPLGDYSDAQVGAAAREVLRDCQTTLTRLFDFQPVVDGEEGSAHETNSGPDAGIYRLTGNVTGEPPFTGQLVHHGWRTAQCDLPSWSGSREAAMIVAPVELELP